MHVIKLNGYNATTENGERLELGTFNSHGEEQLQIVKAPDWVNLSVIATFNPPNKKPVQVAVDPITGVIKVPKEATADLYGVGTIVFVGVADGVQRISADCEYIVRKHSNASGTGPAEPTPDLLQQVLTLSKDAQIAAKNAEQSAKNAEQSAESAAKDAADTVKPYKEEAVQAATAAALSEKNAAESKATAQEAAERATQAGIAASNAAEEAERSAGIATDAAGGSALNAENAHKSALNAQQSANNAAESQSAAAASAASAQRNAEQVAIDAKTAVDAKVAAAGSADAAAGSANAAGNSASAAARSEQAAGASEVKAAESEKAAKASEQAAAESAQAALESKTAAATSEVNAAASAKKAQDVADSLPEDYTTAVNDIATLKQQVANITPDDSTIGEKPWSSKNIVDMLCPPLEESGNPVVCYPVAGYPLSVKAKWEPMQEGSGTPYPAGGGKNQLNPAGYEAATKTINGITFTRLNTGEVVVNGTATETAIYALIESFSYSVSLSTDKNWSIVGENVISAQGLVSGVTVTRPSDDTSLYIRVESGATVKTTVQPQIKKGNTLTAWEPYENIRPIKGRDSVQVEQRGENLLNIKLVNEIVGRSTIKNDNGWLQVDGELQGGNLWLAIGYVLRPGTYCAYFFGGDSMQDNGVLRIYGDVQALMEPKRRQAILTVKNTSKVNVYLHVNRSFTLTTKFAVAIVSGSTAPTTYTPYIGQTNTLTLPETIYGGEVDAVNGEGQETWKMLTLDGTTNKFTQSDNFWRMPSNSAPGVVNGYATMCSHFPTNTFGGNQTGNYIFTRADIMSRYFPDIDALNAYIAAQYAAGTPVQVCYKLKEPVPFTATGAQPFPALAGANTVLTDADSATVTGRADPIKRIEDLEAAVTSIN